MDQKELNSLQHHKKTRIHEQQKTKAIKQLVKATNDEELKEINEEFEKQRFMTPEELIVSNQKIASLKKGLLHNFRYNLQIQKNGYQRDQSFKNYLKSKTECQRSILYADDLIL